MSAQVHRARVLRVVLPLVLLSTSLPLVGCAEQPTQLLVTIESDLPTDQEPPILGDGVLRAVRVEVCEESCTDPRAPRDERRWTIGRRADQAQHALPISFGVAPRDPARPGAVEIIAYALRSSGTTEDVLFSTARTIAFTAGRRVPVPLFLAAGCRSRSCPTGTTCGPDGECIASGGDAGVAPDDASASDARVDVDAGTGCGPSAPGGLGTPTLEGERGVTSGAVTAVSFAPDQSTLTGGLGTSAFDWDGAHTAVPAYFVSRRGTAGTPSWTTFITYDPDRRSPWASVAQIVEQDGVVYVAAQNAEAWTVGTLTIPEHVPGSATSSLRVGTLVLALDATTGEPIWAHRFKTTGVTEFVGGLANDETGVWLASRGFGGTFGSFQVDGTTRTVDRGDGSGRLHLVHLSPSGDVLDVHGFGGAADFDVASVGAGEVLVSFFAATTVTGLSPAPPAGAIIVARLDASGSASWSSSIDCSAGSWELMTAGRAGRLSVSGSRVFAGFAAITPRSTSSCTELTVTPSTSAAQHIARTGAAASVGLVALDLCAGGWSGAVWSASVNGSPLAAFTSLASDARGVVATGYFGAGGANLGLGFLPGLEVGRGTDGFFVVLDRDLMPSSGLLLGGTNVGPFAPDDGGEGVALGRDAIELATAMSGDQTVGGITVHQGGRVLRHTLP